MTIKSSEMLKTAIAILKGEKNVTKWEDIVALRFAASEAKAKAKAAEEKIPNPASHSGRYSGHKPSANTAREAASAMLNSALDSIVLLGKSLSKMTVLELRKVAESASNTAEIALAILGRIGTVQDQGILVRNALSEREILKIVSKVLQKPTKEYRDLASPTQ